MGGAGQRRGGLADSVAAGRGGGACARRLFRRARHWHANGRAQAREHKSERSSKRARAPVRACARARSRAPRARVMMLKGGAEADALSVYHHHLRKFTFAYSVILETCA